VLANVAPKDDNAGRSGIAPQSFISAAQAEANTAAAVRAARTAGTAPAQGPSKRIHYCHTHGNKMNHTSAQCKNPKAGHVATATLQNRMGGSTLNVAGA